MQGRRWVTVVPRLAAGAYPLLVFGVCRRGVSEADLWGLAALYLSLSLPLAFLALWAASAFAGKRVNHFASSLRDGREPLCTFFARHVHHTLSPELLKYTRSVTKVWLFFFISTGCISSLLFLFASNSVWAFFTNLLMPVLVVGVFVVENACRRFFLPPTDRVGLLGTYSAIRRGGLGRAMRTSAAQSKAVT